ncbi:hypothetical protein N7508_004718 [Penicillium antarcticum]|uniref:uncharacterized protein n=1 Tax=Penicillium antarcticum TaxID=416450 RepID=UPI0023948289|nr:uncharacterized protein N7508_004718 [Penicillium antarcticum]KAJ5305703.1 hypothetical protein N7508_004718 [Penicillium antarcticum]
MPESYHKPMVWMSYGSFEQHPTRKKEQSDEQYQNRLTMAKERRMAENCDEMSLRLQQSGQLRLVKNRKYEEEDHGSVIAVVLNGAIFYIIDHPRCS